MSKYSVIAEELQRKVDNGEITMEQANEVNDLAYDLYVEKPKQLEADINMLEEFLDAVKEGKVTVTKELREMITSIGGEASDDSSDDEKEDDKDDDKTDEPEEGSEETPEGEADESCAKEGCAKEGCK